MLTSHSERDPALPAVVALGVQAVPVVADPILHAVGLEAEKTIVGRIDDHDLP